MRSKAPLALMEQAVMVLVFALAAVLCLRVFVWSDRTSEIGAATDMAVLKAQSAAEIIKNKGKSGQSEEDVLKAVSTRLGGTYSDADAKLTVGYDADWQPAEGEDVRYVLIASKDGEGSGALGSVHIEVTENTQGETLFEITAAWQKEA